ncbi:branched-chain amino acid aminotransferase [Phycisphaera mikurensis]|nr:branched-chain-amino-acid transaminase [Phycisphaera mikurensis]MBB6440323.1 branched-chain amino acid aminotransferase [Phycisphaera mikurensis]
MSDNAPTEPLETADPLSAYANRYVWIDGDLKPAAEATVSVFDHGVLYGDGVFEGIRFYGGRVLKLRTHVARLFESARAIRLALPYTPEQLEEATRRTVAKNALSDGYIRLVATRGAGTLGLNPFQCPRPCVYIIAASIQLYPASLYETGLEVVSSSVMRNHPQALSPRIKSLNYLNNILAKIEAIDRGVLEAVMYNPTGHVAECTGDNVFLVRERDGERVLFTPPLSAGALEGITMNLVIRLAQEAGFAVVRENLTRHDLYTAEEFFLTGTAAEVIPVKSIDGRVIGDGSPGPITRKLIAAFRKLIADGVPED